MTDEPLPRKQISLDPILAIAIVMAVFCALFFHGYEAFRYTLSIDEEQMLSKPDLLEYIRRARWGAIAWSWLRTPLPVTHLLAGLLLYGAAFVLLIQRLRVEHWESVVVAAGLFFGFPVLLYAFAFSNLALTIGIGTLASVCALYVASRKSLARFFLAALLVAFVTASYQSLFYFLLVVFFADLAKLDNEFDWSEQRKRFVWYGSIVVGGLALYGLISLALLEIFGQQVSYLPSYFKPDALTTHAFAILKTTLEQAWNLYRGAATFVSFRFFYRLLLVVCVAVLILTIFSRCRVTKVGALLWAGLLAAIIAVPFIQHPLNGGDMPYRTLIALPAAVAALALFASEASPLRLRRWVILPIMVGVIFEFSAANNKQYYAGHWALERDKVLGTQILSRIDEMFPSESVRTIAVVGAGPTKSDKLILQVPSSTLGASFFRWDQGNCYRVAAFLNFLSTATYRCANPDRAELAFELAEELPSWPERGSITRIEEIVLIKLSAPTDMQLRLLCKNRSSDYCSKYRR